jgi:molybdate transport system substrate-binding protein
MWLLNVRKTINKYLPIFAIFCLACVGCGKEEQGVNIYAASSLTEAVSATVERYEEISGVKAKVVFAGSNHLAAQLRDGANADVFITADAALIEGLGFQEILEGFAYNSLVVVKPIDFVNKSFELDDLTQDKGLIAICSAGVPCGDATKAKFGIINADTYEMNVKAVLSRVASIEVDLGIVYTTDLKNEPKVIEAWPQEITCPCVSYAAASKGKKGNGFSDFLTSDVAKEIFSDHGFSL